ncbi:MAG: NifU N-terminal domain-containing protein [Phycisphaerales bacterium]
MSVKTESTPNPNALKFVCDAPIVEGIRSYRSAGDADDALSRSVFEIGGVTSVLINGAWMTVNKDTDASWGPITRRVTELLDSQ